MKNLSLFILFFVTAFALQSCSTSSTVSNSTNDTSSRKLPETICYIDEDQDGVFEKQLDLTELPTPMQGQNQWTRDFYNSLSYPAAARENSISGIVTLDVIFDEFGQITDVSINRSLSSDCDTASENAFMTATQQGYTPLVVEGQARKFKLEKSVGFWLH